MRPASEKRPAGRCPPSSASPARRTPSLIYYGCQIRDGQTTGGKRIVAGEFPCPKKSSTASAYYVIHFSLGVVFDRYVTGRRTRSSPLPFPMIVKSIMRWPNMKTITYESLTSKRAGKLPTFSFCSPSPFPAGRIDKPASFTSSIYTTVKKKRKKESQRRNSRLEQYVLKRRPIRF